MTRLFIIACIALFAVSSAYGADSGKAPAEQLKKKNEPTLENRNQEKDEAEKRNLEQSVNFQFFRF